MCDILTTYEGAELAAVRDLRLYGIDVPDSIDGNRCLCSLNLPELLAEQPTAWRQHGWANGWAEVGPDGRTWIDGYDTTTPSEHNTNVNIVTRSDGQQPKTIEQIVAERTG